MSNLVSHLFSEVSKLLDYFDLSQSNLSGIILNFLDFVSSIPLMVIIRQNIVFTSMLFYLLWYIKAYLSVSIFK
jgi:hypothetical protein